MPQPDNRVLSTHCIQNAAQPYVPTSSDSPLQGLPATGQDEASILPHTKEEGGYLVTQGDNKIAPNTRTVPM